MNPAIHIEKYQDDDFPVVIEPWIVEQRGDRNLVGPASKKEPGKVRERVCSTERNHHDQPQTAKNDFYARLLAAAPEMLLAIVDAISELETADHPIHCIGELKALVSRVEGTL